MIHGTYLKRFQLNIHFSLSPLQDLVLLEHGLVIRLGLFELPILPGHGASLEEQLGLQFPIAFPVSFDLGDVCLASLLHPLEVVVLGLKVRSHPGESVIFVGKLGLQFRDGVLLLAAFLLQACNPGDLFV